MNTKLLIVIAVLVVALGGSTGYFYYQYSELKRDPSQISKDEVKELIATLSEFIVLPEDEVPTIATISDAEKLRDQPFFANAKKGDKVLIYAQARKAILYDPVARKIIDVAPLNLNSSSTLDPSPAF